MTLHFPRHPAVCDPMTDTVVFRGEDGGAIVPCRISQEALQDHFRAMGDAASLVAAYEQNAAFIQAKAAAMYAAAGAKGAVLLKTADFP